MFGFIKNLITGIMKFITGLLPGKKKGNGYYLELKEEAETTPPVAAAKATAEKVAAVAKSAADKVTELTESEADKAVAETNGAKQSPAPVAAAPETSNGAKDVKKPSRKTSIKSAKKAKAEAKPESTVELVQTAEGVTIEVKEDKAPAVAAKAQPTETTFAPKYLMPTSTNGRRRPGANMNSFLEMARQVKTPANKSK
ncbi:hypothetical protein [Fischerella thermalis]|jgi:hypothetical protein|uniref:Uncharacterized protein n=1 Tax=Fischerella thermalis JSC-11 TaxID=741277 RepID=G6FZ21_9CYAN|nr:hypothetical protein [Fischerella thermalis]EHC09039.1 hypothetical protein FJSC11DRAFT_4120 [Fischerella thermalis JSC-11]PLZ68554.1 hypothetical protein CBP23_01910 [Fischerella thermalis WC344]PLZ71322.1 hypothetical protein CBP22_05085 [Fischerella thermalis WC249]PMB16319.1 hypothetical protein CEN48_03110 [Fischerella thermalis CCMEE 5282]PMB32338.1 hypothetical protein CEN43_12405 [Fischerella thermalis BR2B]